MAVIMYNKINHGFVCRVEVTKSCNKSKLIFRLWNIVEGVHLSSISLVLPGIQRTTSGTGTDFIQPFKLIYSFSNVWFKKIPLPPTHSFGFLLPHPIFPGIFILEGTGTHPLPPGISIFNVKQGKCTVMLSK